VRARALTSGEGSQLVEFAVALPLLVVFVVGIFDFGQAFNIKLKLNGAAREGAQLAASLPTGDLTSTGGGLNPVPSSVDAVRSVVDSYLKAANLNDCGLSTQTGTLTVPLTWTYVANASGCAGPLTLTINRAYAFKVTINGTQTDAVCTQVTITYPYMWHFNNVIQFLVPGASYAGVTLIPTDATAQNLN
jgi:Flp pilus assembly protein TadG